jgi:hypothetical protein
MLNEIREPHLVDLVSQVMPLCVGVDSPLGNRVDKTLFGTQVWVSAVLHAKHAVFARIASKLDVNRLLEVMGLDYVTFWHMPVSFGTSFQMCVSGLKRT